MERTKVEMLNKKTLSWLDEEHDIKIVLYPHIGKKNYITYSILVCYDSNIYIIRNSVGGIVVETIHYSQYSDTHIFSSNITEEEIAIEIGIIFGMYIVESVNKEFGQFTDYTDIMKVMTSILKD